MPAENEALQTLTKGEHGHSHGQMSKLDRWLSRRIWTESWHPRGKRCCHLLSICRATINCSHGVHVQYSSVSEKLHFSPHFHRSGVRPLSNCCFPTLPRRLSILNAPSWQPIPKSCAFKWLQVPTSCKQHPKRHQSFHLKRDAFLRGDISQYFAPEGFIKILFTLRLLSFIVKIAFWENVDFFTYTLKFYVVVAQSLKLKDDFSNILLGRSTQDETGVYVAPDGMEYEPPRCARSSARGFLSVSETEETRWRSF